MRGNISCLFHGLLRRWNVWCSQWVEKLFMISTIWKKMAPILSTPQKHLLLLDKDTLHAPPLQSNPQDIEKWGYLHTLSPYLKYNQFKPNESQMNVRFTENIDDSVGVGSANSYSLLQEDRTNAQFTTVPLDATRRNLPEFHIPTMYQNSSPPKPVLKFSVDSLLGLSEGRESCQNHSISEYVDIMS